MQQKDYQQIVLELEAAYYNGKVGNKSICIPLKLEVVQRNVKLTPIQPALWTCMLLGVVLHDNLASSLFSFCDNGILYAHPFMKVDR